MKENEVIEIEEENNDNDSISSDKIDPKQIDITAEQNSLSTIIEMIDDNAIDLNPEFQRSGDLWKEDTMSSLIESILLRLPLPAFYFDASNDDKWLVVDGLQRLWTLKKFILENDLVLQDLPVLINLNGKSYEDLNTTLKRKMARYQITTYLIKPGTPKKVKYDIFRRINTGGLILTPQEIRHSLNQGKPANYLKAIAEDISFKDIITLDDKRMGARELILRYLAFSNTPYTEYEPPFPSFLDKAMEKLYKLEDQELEQLKLNLWQALKTCQKLFEDHIFSRSILSGNRKLNGALFEVWTVLIGRLNEEEIKHLLSVKRSIRSKFKQKLKETDFIKSISSSKSTKSSVIMRFETIETLIKEVLT